MSWNCSLGKALGPPHVLELLFGESLGTTTCLRTVVWGKQGHAPCEILLLHQTPFPLLVKFCGDHKTVKKF